MLQYHGVIQKEFDTLTETEMIQHAKDLQQSRLTEISKLFRLQCFRRIPRHAAQNLLDAKWVYKWKKIDGKKAIKSRITLRGFREKGDYQTYAGTAARCTQRIINSLAMMSPYYILQSWDIGSAFAQGLSFAELARKTGEHVRSVQLEIDAGDVELIRAQEGFESFCPLTETLDLQKPVYGLKDAPRAWELRLRQLLTEGGLRPSMTDPRLYMLDIQDLPDKEKKGLDYFLNTGPRSGLLLACTTHVDDIKIMGLPKFVTSLQQHLEKSVGKLTVEMTLSELLMARERIEGRGQSSQAKTLQARWESGSLRPELWACIDAKSVYDALMAPDFHIPSEDSLCLHLLALRNDIAVKKLRALLWIDTRSMLADALTKGKVDKTQLTLAANAGVLKIPADHVIIKTTIERDCET
eukprot:5948730-Amphidinium_carterae.1